MILWIRTSKIVIYLGNAGLENDVEYNIEYRITLPEGELRYVHSVAALLRDEQGKPLRVIGVNVDVTERMKAQESQEPRLVLTHPANCRPGPFFRFDGVGMAAFVSSSRGEFPFSALAGPFQSSADTAIPSYFPS